MESGKRKQVHFPISSQLQEVTGNCRDTSKKNTSRLSHPGHAILGLRWEHPSEGKDGRAAGHASSVLGRAPVS